MIMTKQNTNNNTWMKKQVKKGLCIFCNETPLPNQKRCQYHFLKQISKSRLGDVKYADQLLEKLVKQNHKCFYTNKKLILGVNASVDHFMPISKYPELRFEFGNVVWCDATINKMKLNIIYEDFIILCRQVIDKHDL